MEDKYRGTYDSAIILKDYVLFYVKALAVVADVCFTVPTYILRLRPVFILHHHLANDFDGPSKTFYEGGIFLEYETTLESNDYPCGKEGERK